jgi:hypothetical protein
MKVNEELWKEFINHKCILECQNENESKKFKQYFLEKIHKEKCEGIFYEFKTKMQDAQLEKTIFAFPFAEIHSFLDIANMKSILYSALFIENEQLQKEKKYSALEILHMIENNELTNNDIILDKNGFGFSSLVIKNNCPFNLLMKVAPYTIHKKEFNYVTFDEAVKNGKKIKYKDWDTFYSISDVMRKLLTMPFTAGKDILDEKAWSIEYDK